MIWVTRAGAKVDRIACPWLIRRFIDPEAQFRFVAPEQVLETAKATGAKSFDAPGAEYGHRKAPEGETCSFVTLMREYGLWGKDAALDAVAKIVNHADVGAGTRAWSAAEGDGLAAIARGFALLTKDDQRKLDWEFPMYDALYAWAKEKTAVAEER